MKDDIIYILIQNQVFIMLDPLDFLDPILHILKFVYKIFDVAKTYLHLLMGSVESFLRWMYARHEQLRNLGLLFAALIGLPLLIWRGVSLDRSSRAALIQADNAEVQAKSATNQAESASKSHVADTYTRAIEQLGSVDNKGEPNLELRLGGLYALEKIAKANEDYHPQIMEVLCAYVRMHCPIKHEVKETDDTKPKNFESLRMDIQACLTVICRRENSFDTENPNLSAIKLNGAFLSNMNFSKVILTGANLNRAFLNEANLNEASLFFTDLNKAVLIGAKNLTCEQIQSAQIDRETKLPDYIKVTWADDGNFTCEKVGDSD